jgi:NADH-quinone oxidoreductase subunit N
MMLAVTEPLPTPDADLMAISPMLFTIASGLLIILMLAVKRFRHGRWYGLVAIVGAVVSTVFGWLLWRDVTGGDVRFAYSGMIAVDGFGVFLILLLNVTLILAVLISQRYLEREGIDKGEYYALMLFATAGMQFMAVSNNLVMIFLSLEILSVPLYVLAAFRRDNEASQEAGVKYLLLGAFSSAVMLYGIALLYGGVGSTNLGRMAEFFAENVSQRQGMVLLGMALTIAGLAFKIAAVPFHMWTPDVYQGSPTPVVAFMASGAKIAGFAALFRLLETGLAALQLDWQWLMWGLAVATMLFGAIAAIVQRDVKRIMAYSSIANAGFILVGLAGATGAGVRGAVFYLAAYTFMIAGALAIVTLVGRKGERYTSVDDYRGLFHTEPLYAGLLTLFLFGLAGIPGTAGFVAKFAVFEGAAEGGQWILITVGAVASVISLYIYLRLILTMYMSDPVTDDDVPTSRLRPGAALGMAIGIAAVFTVLLGVLPQGLLDMAGKATLIF